MKKMNFSKEDGGNKQYIGYLSIIIGIALFSLLEIACKKINGSGNALGPFWIATSRFVLGAIILSPGLFQGLRVSKRALSGIFFCSFISGTLALTIFYQLALMPAFHLNASVGAIIICANPIFVIFLTPLLSKNKNKGVSRIEGAFVAFVGIVVASLSSFHLGEGSVVGILFMFIAAILFALQVPFSKNYIAKYGAVKYTGLFLLFSAITSIVVAFSTEGTPHLIQFSSNWKALLVMGVLGSGVGYFFYFGGFKYVEPAKGAVLFFLKPIFAPIFAFFILSDGISLILMLGVFIILFGIYITYRPREKRLFNIRKRVINQQ
jgi:drug/metabolite transporter (DMT)-like permease